MKNNALRSAFVGLTMLVAGLTGAVTASSAVTAGDDVNSVAVDPIWDAPRPTGSEPDPIGDPIWD
ncbi:hypothetical protein U9R90_16680 [Streptomyces sp. E11-3]|uniref:hypothetical protein n=1 Tax=Streptomyces sp. E11-3 TaxID=3110112 RepID=UPI00397FC0AF